MGYLDLVDWKWVIGLIVPIVIAVMLAHWKLRKEINKPDVTISFYNFNSVLILNLVNKEKKEINYFESDGNEKHEGIGILHKFENIGLTAAKDVRIEWKFNFRKAQKQIKKLLPASLRLGLYKHVTAIESMDGQDVISTLYEIDDLATEFDFVMPRKDEAFDKSPTIPAEITDLFVMYYLAKNKLLNIRQFPTYLPIEEFDAFPAIQGKITFTDLNGKQYRKTTTISMSFSVDTSDDETEAVKDTVFNALELSIYLTGKTRKS